MPRRHDKALWVRPIVRLSCVLVLGSVVAICGRMPVAVAQPPTMRRGAQRDGPRGSPVNAAAGGEGSVSLSPSPPEGISKRLGKVGMRGVEGSGNDARQGPATSAAEVASPSAASIGARQERVARIEGGGRAPPPRWWNNDSRMVVANPAGVTYLLQNETKHYIPSSEALRCLGSTPTLVRNIGALEELQHFREEYPVRCNGSDRSDKMGNTLSSLMALGREDSFAVRSDFCAGCDLSLSFWVWLYEVDTSKPHAIVHSAPSSATELSPSVLYGLGKRPDSFFFAFSGRLGQLVGLHSTHRVQARQWTHIAIAVSDYVVTGYINGVVEARMVFYGGLASQPGVAQVHSLVFGMTVRSRLAGISSAPLLLSSVTQRQQPLHNVSRLLETHPVRQVWKTLITNKLAGVSGLQAGIQHAHPRGAVRLAAAPRGPVPTALTVISSSQQHVLRHYHSSRPHDIPAWLVSVVDAVAASVQQSGAAQSLADSILRKLAKSDTLAASLRQNRKFVLSGSAVDDVDQGESATTAAVSNSGNSELTSGPMNTGTHERPRSEASQVSPDGSQHRPVSHSFGARAAVMSRTLQLSEDDVVPLKGDVASAGDTIVSGGGPAAREDHADARVSELSTSATTPHMTSSQILFHRAVFCSSGVGVATKAESATQLYGSATLDTGAAIAECVPEQAVHRLVSALNSVARDSDAHSLLLQTEDVLPAQEERSPWTTIEEVMDTVNQRRHSISTLLLLLSRLVERPGTVRAVVSRGRHETPAGDAKLPSQRVAGVNTASRSSVPARGTAKFPPAAERATADSGAPGRAAASLMPQDTRESITPHGQDVITTPKAADGADGAKSVGSEPPDAAPESRFSDALLAALQRDDANSQVLLVSSDQGPPARMSDAEKSLAVQVAVSFANETVILQAVDPLHRNGSLTDIHTQLLGVSLDLSPLLALATRYELGHDEYGRPRQPANFSEQLNYLFESETQHETAWPSAQPGVPERGGLSHSAALDSVLPAVRLSRSCPSAAAALLQPAQRAASDYSKIDAKYGATEEVRLSDGNFLGLMGEDDDVTAMQMEAADKGDARAQMWLGAQYYWGRAGLPRDAPRARDLFEAAAEQGLPEARYNLGVMQMNGGAGVPADQEAALENFQVAADQGYAPAQNGLANRYLRGVAGSVVKNVTKAVELLEAAAKGGSVDANYNLGRMYASGGQVARNRRKAVEHFAVAAHQGHVSSALELGKAYVTVGSWLDTYDAEAFDSFVESEFLRMRSSANVAPGTLPTESSVPSRSALRAQYLALPNATVMLEFKRGQSINHVKMPVRYDCDAGVKLLRIAVAAGAWGSLLRRGLDHYLNNEPSSALPLYSIASELGYEVAASNVAWLMLQGADARLKAPLVAYVGEMRTNHGCPLSEIQDYGAAANSVNLWPMMVSTVMEHLEQLPELLGYLFGTGTLDPVHPMSPVFHLPEALPCRQQALRAAALRYQMVSAARGYEPSVMAVAGYWRFGGTPHGTSVAAGWYLQSVLSDSSPEGLFNLGVLALTGDGGVVLPQQDDDADAGMRLAKTFFDGCAQTSEGVVFNTSVLQSVAPDSVKSTAIVPAHKGAFDVIGEDATAWIPALFARYIVDAVILLRAVGVEVSPAQVAQLLGQSGTPPAAAVADAAPSEARSEVDDAQLIVLVVFSLALVLLIRHYRREVVHNQP